MPKYKLDKLLQKSIAAFNALPKEEQLEKLRQQRISWVYGNIALDNPNITREMVDEAAKNWT